MMFSSLISIICSLPLYLTTVTAAPQKAQTASFSATATSGLSAAQYTSLPNTFSAPHLSLVNSTVFEWWYFSVLPRDASQYALVTYFTSTGNASVTGVPGTQILDIAASFKFPNGSWALSVSLPDAATIAWEGPLGSGVEGVYKSGSDVVGAFDISPRLSHGSFSLINPAAGVNGSISYRNTAPAHFPCSADAFAAGQDMRVYPNVGWVNPVPAGIAEGQIVLGDTVLDFDGAFVYADQNWGDRPFAYKNFYWGRATLGKYHAVWWNGTAPDGTSQTSAYLAHGDHVLLSSCDDGSVSVKPFGAGATYPPVLGHADFDYLNVVFEVPGEGTFAFNVTKAAVLPSHDPTPPGLIAKGISVAGGGWVGGGGHWSTEHNSGPVEWEIWAHE